MTQTISSCRECPLCYMPECGDPVCMHPKVTHEECDIVEDVYRNALVMPWCPLKNEPFTITL